MPSTRFSILAALALVLAACNASPNARLCETTGIVCPAGTECAAAQPVCIINKCGNAVVDPGEKCDDGNILDGDGCSHDCTSQEICGNGVVDPGEACDDGNTTSGDGCSADCKSRETCGNGILDTAAGETCDDGNTVDGDGCDHDCKFASCGNNILDPGEACDDGNHTDGDGCSKDCLSKEVCGNHIVDMAVGEVCDDGNTKGGDGCSANCKSTEICGNCIVDGEVGEVCDTCALTGTPNPNCSADCRSGLGCGNGIVDHGTGETCDDGNTDNNDDCTNSCQPNVCGDGIVDSDGTHKEQCDLGSANGGSSACSLACTTAACGNHIVDAGEDCDDGNAVSTDGCVACHFAKCGDGFVEAGVEQCDGAPVGGHACSANCTLQQCGNGIVDPGEQCDDGNGSANDGCGPTCLFELCGDGIKNDVTEACDPAGTTAPNTPAQCNSDCTLASCGDGKVDHSFVPAGAPGGEQCDPPSAVTGCSATCQLEHCGDGHIDASFGENCDNGAGNSLSGPCLPWCQLATCGDGVVEPNSNVTGAEACDFGKDNGRTACVYGATSCQVCTSQCKLAPGTTAFCGDHNLDTADGEACDDATDGRTQCSYIATNASNNTCSVCALGCQVSTATGPYCGDAAVSNGEGCDNGFANNGATACAYGASSCTVCTSACTSASGTTSFCGDGTPNGPEACDTAGDSQQCNQDCTAPSCGDGYVNKSFTPLGAPGVEQCEPPGTATCDANCQTITPPGPVCGNGVQEHGEQCDGGDLNGFSCADLAGFAGGALACNTPASCTFDTTHCFKCGDSVCDSADGETAAICPLDGC